MGSLDIFQPLTREDRITVMLYRAGILISAVVVCISAFLCYRRFMTGNLNLFTPATVNFLLFLLYIAIGLSVFFIHLYVGSFHRGLKKVYYLSLACLGVLIYAGHGSPAVGLFGGPYYRALLMIPLSLCLGFVTAKEAFCFKLFEGYLLAIIMPAYIFFYSFKWTSQKGSITGFAIVAVLLVVFTVRKIFMPLHADIGDKSAYQP